MKIHEYQAKDILRQYGVSVPRGVVCFSEHEVIAAVQQLGGSRWVVKAQIHAGGRGQGGGIGVANTIQEVSQFAGKFLGMKLVTHQTNADGQEVRQVLVEEGVQIAKEYYVGMVIDRSRQRIVLMASSEGGMEIEAVAVRSPEKIHKVWIDPGTGLTDGEIDNIARLICMPANALDQVRVCLHGLYRAFVEKEAMLVELNPLVLTENKNLLALDAKINFDSNALFRHPEIVALRDLNEEDPAEVEASAFGLSYISLDGNIGCLVNGAGLAMATMDIIKLYGGLPANFLDVGGGASKEKVTEAFKLMLKNPDLKAILVNIFGGIMKCDVIAEGVVAAAREVHLNVPLVVRLEGTNVEIGKRILAESGLPVISAGNMAEAAAKAVAAAKGASCPF